MEWLRLRDRVIMRGAYFNRARVDNGYFDADTDRADFTDALLRDGRVDYLSVRGSRLVRTTVVGLTGMDRIEGLAEATLEGVKVKPAEMEVMRELGLDKYCVLDEGERRPQLIKLTGSEGHAIPSAASA